MSKYQCLKCGEAATYIPALHTIACTSCHSALVQEHKDPRTERWHATYNAALSKLATTFPEQTPIKDDPNGVPFGATIHAACVAHANRAHGELATACANQTRGRTDEHHDR